MENWKIALEIICEKAKISSKEIEWILVGSAGSALQGCKFEPNDLDIYVRKCEEVLMFAMLLDEYIVEEKCLLPNSDPNWISSKHERVYTEGFPSGFTWTKARFLIEGTLVEVVHIGESAGIPDSLDGEGIWEGGKYVWELTKEVPVIYQMVKTVPLEIQLESNLRRKREDRVTEIVNTLHRMGVNETLLIQALSINHQKYRDIFVNV